MKNMIRPLFPVLLYSMIAFSCDSGFLKYEPDIKATSESQIFISPAWESADYTVHIPEAQNAGFQVTRTPGWLHVSARSGQFSNGVATIRCSASEQADYTGTGFYNSFMALHVEGIGEYLVSVSYINEGTPEIRFSQTSLTLQLQQNTAQALLGIQNGGEGILLYGIAEKPDWIMIKTPEGNELPENYIFPVRPYASERLFIALHPDYLMSGSRRGDLVIFSNAVNQSTSVITVQYDMGNPVLYCHDSQLDFGLAELTRTLQFNNQGNGFLSWSVESLPGWLSVSEQSGVLHAYDYKTLTFTADRSNIPNGHHTHIVNLKSNDPNNPSFAITVTIGSYAANPDNIKAIEGTVTDAWMDKASGVLYLATAQPNRILAYNTLAKVFDRAASLSQAPNCFSISDDGRRTVIGHDGRISVLDMNSFTVTKTIEANYNIFDIEWGVDGWCCYMPGDEVQHVNLQWVDVDWGSTLSYISLYGKTLIKKIPSTNHIIASRLAVSPSGISVFDSKIRDRINFFHEEINEFWFSSGGNFLFSALNKIYRTSSLITPNSDIFMPPINSFKPAPNRIHWIEPNDSARTIWVLSSATVNYSDTRREILQYKDNDYTLAKKYYYDYLYNGSQVQAQYIFSNLTGSELFAIKVAVSDNNRNAWSIEHIPTD